MTLSGPIVAERAAAELAAARACFLRNDYLPAERHARAALTQARQAGDFAAQVEALTWLGAALTQQGHYDEALEYLHGAVALSAERGGTPHAGRACNYLAVVHEELGDFPLAVGYYERGLAEARAHADAEVEIFLLANLGDGLVAHGDHVRAPGVLARAIECAAAVGDHAHVGYCLCARARLHAACGADEAALADLQAAIAAAERGSSPRILAEALTALARHRAAEGDRDAALAGAERALVLMTRHDIRREMFRIHEALADIHEAFGEYREALRHFRELHRLRAGVLDEVLRARVGKLDARIAEERARHAEEIAQLRHGELARALSEVERQAQELKELSQRDPLTGVHNRRHLADRLAAEPSICRCAWP